MAYKTRADALRCLPDNARLSSSFGYQAEGGYTEFWRDIIGRRWRIQHGRDYLDTHGPWTVERCDDDR
jgi:hypothetical protein